MDINLTRAKREDGYSLENTDGPGVIGDVGKNYCKVIMSISPILD